MREYQLCLAWNWEYDADFVGLLESACLARSLNFLQVTPENLAATLEDLKSGELGFTAFLDRASESDARFLPFVFWASERGLYRINPHERAVHAMNKASMHLEFITAGIQTPYTIILPPYDEQPVLAPRDLSPLGGRFTIKPAHGGGGGGVIVQATSFDQALQARLELPYDHYLLQAYIVPAALAGRPAWFRVISCGGLVFPFWWHTATHVYVPVTEEDVSAHGLTPLWSTTRAIGEICGLDVFSTEIALTEGGMFVAVDYVNDPIDLRLQSNTSDGVPDEVVRRIAGRLAELALAYRPLHLA
jgi:hypothetical protein